MMRKITKGQRGFTLIELVMVIVILGVMAAVAIPKYYNMKKDAEISAAKGLFGGIQGAVAIYYAKNKRFPTDAVAVLAETNIMKGDLQVSASGMKITVKGTECVSMEATYDPINGIISYPDNLCQ